MKNKSKLSYIGSAGILGYIFLTIIDRFITKMPDRIYIPISLLIIELILYGNIQNRRKNKKTR